VTHDPLHNRCERGDALLTTSCINYDIGIPIISIRDTALCTCVPLRRNIEAMFAFHGA
jgi:hypothetical protein